MDAFWWILEGLIALGNLGLLVAAMWWARKAYTDKCRWQAYAALMGIEEIQDGNSHLKRKLMAGESAHFKVGSSSVYIGSSAATDLSVTVYT